MSYDRSPFAYSLRFQGLSPISREHPLSHYSYLLRLYSHKIKAHDQKNLFAFLLIRLYRVLLNRVEWCDVHKSHWLPHVIFSQALRALELKTAVEV